VNKLPYIVVALGILAVILYSSIFIVNEREQAIVLRFGEIRRVVQEPGANFKVPLLDTVQILEDRILDLSIDDIRVQVRDGRRYLVDAFIAYRITNPRQFRENVSGSYDIANQNLGTRLESALRRVYGQRSFEAALSAQRAEMMRDVRDQLRPLAADIGINIVDVRIKRTDLLAEVSQRTFDRMKAERLAEAAELRALGTQEKLRIQAEADREATVTIAEAQRDADILRGEGDAERNRIFAEAFQRDPDFFAFYRSMKAYETAIEGSGTTMLLSPDSQFFEFFKDSEGAASGSPSAEQ
jgi:membrane protease subunit HflC